MNGTADSRIAEGRQIRARMEEIQRELELLRDRLDELICEEDDRPKVRGVRATFQLSAAGEAAHEPVAPRLLVPRTTERPIDPVELVRHSASATALFAPAPGARSKREMALLLRTGSDVIAQLGPDPDIEFRAGLFTLDEENVALVPILVRIGPEEAERIYEAWANECPGGAGELLGRLADQPYVVIWLFGDGGQLERMLHTPNSLQDFAGQAGGLVARARTLSPDAFHQARRAVYKQHSSVRSLWTALKV